MILQCISEESNEIFLAGRYRLLAAVQYYITIASIAPNGRCPFVPDGMPLRTSDEATGGLAPYWAVVSPYCIAVGAIYQWGYWHKFHINIWPYVSVIDIVKLSAFPVVTGAAFGIVGMLLSEASPGRDRYPPGGGAQTAFAKAIKPYLRFAWPALIFVCLCVSYLTQEPMRWAALAALLGAPAGIYAEKLGFLSGITHRPIRNAMIYGCFLIPGLAATTGETNARAILTGTEYSYLVGNAIGDVAVPQTGAPDSKVKYLGTVGDYVFMLGGDNAEIIVMKLDTKQLLTLGHFPVSN